ncbi:MAG: hypothetical protein Q9164_006192 [Protoblastenia rupestris]
MASTHQNGTVARKSASNIGPRPSKLPVTKRIRFKHFLRINPTGSFAATQQYKRSATGTEDKAFSSRLDRQKSGEEVDRLLKVRRQMIKNARGVGDEVEVERLLNLDVFDGVYGKVSCEKGEEVTKEVEVVGKAGGLEGDDVDDEEGSTTDKTGCELWVQSLDADKVTKAKSVLSVLSFETGEAGRFQEMAASVESGDSAECLDVFSHLALGGTDQTERIKPRKTTSQADNRRCRTPTCKGGKACARNVRGRGCCHPRPQPPITAAQQRIAYFEQSLIIMQLTRDLELMKNVEDGLSRLGDPEIEEVKLRVETACESVVFRQLKIDMSLVDCYEVAMEERCADGVWWEAWMVMRELRGKGIVGSVSS